MISFPLNDLIEKLDFDTPSSMPKLGIYKVGLHLIHIFLAFITFCVTVPVIAAENKYKGSSQAAPNYTLAVALITLFVSAPLAIFPWTSMSKRGFVAVRKFFLRPRTTVIFTCFLALGWFIAMISMTGHSINASNCALDKKYKGDKIYLSDWSKQCNSASASAAFSWISFFVGVGTVICSAILFWHEKKLRHATNEATNGEFSSSTMGGNNSTIVDMKDSENNKVMQAPNGPSSPYLSSPPASIAAAGNDFVSPYSPPTQTPYAPQPNESYEGPITPYSPQLQPPSPYLTHSIYNSAGSSYHQEMTSPQYNNAAGMNSPYPATAAHEAYKISSLYQYTAGSPAIYPSSTPSHLGPQ